MFMLFITENGVTREYLSKTKDWSFGVLPIFVGERLMQTMFPEHWH